MKLSQELIAILSVGATLMGLQVTFFVGTRGELRDQIGSVRGEMGVLRDEMRDQISTVRGELRDQLGAVRDEMSVLREDVRHDLDGLRADIQDIRADVRQLRDKLLAPS